MNTHPLSGRPTKLHNTMNSGSKKSWNHRLCLVVIAQSYASHTCKYFLSTLSTPSNLTATSEEMNLNEFSTKIRQSPFKLRLHVNFEFPNVEVHCSSFPQHRRTAASLNDSLPPLSAQFPWLWAVAVELHNPC
jgi:hypothetical protein